MDVTLQAMLDTLADQRNAALDAVAQKNGHIAALNARVAELEAEVVKLKPDEGSDG